MKLGGSMLWNIFDSETQPATTGFAASRVKRLTNGAFVALIGLCAPMALGQSYIPPFVSAATTTLFSGASSLSPGQVAVDKAGNVFYINHASPFSLYEIPYTAPAAATTTPVLLVTGLGQYNSNGLFVDPKGNLWVANGNGTGTPSGGTQEYIGLLEIPAGTNGLPNTAAITAGGETVGQLAAANCSATSTVPCVWQDSAYATNLTGYYAQPSSLYVDGSGNVYFVDYYDNTSTGKYNRIVKFNTATPGTGTLLADNLPSNNAAQIALDGAGVVYYADSVTGNGSGGKVSSVSAGTLTTVGTTASSSLLQITSATGVASDAYGNLYISGTSNGVQQVSEVPFEGSAIKFADEFGVASGSAALANSVSYGGAVDANGNYYYANSSMIVQVQLNQYNFGNVPVGTFVTPASTVPAPTLNLFLNATIVNGGSYYPTSSPNANTNAALLQSFPFYGPKNNYSGGGGSFALGDSTANLVFGFQPVHPGLLKGSYAPRYNASPNLTEVTVNLLGVGVGPQPLFFPGTPSSLFTSSVPSSTGSATNLNAPTGIAVDTFGNIFVADTGNGKVVADCLATTTYNVATFNSFCAGNPGPFPTGFVESLGTSFTSPVGIALDGANNLYVLDSSADTVTMIQEQNSSNTSILVAATATFGGAALSGPMGIALDGYANVYIADTGNNRVVKAHQFGATATDNVVAIPSTTTFGGTKLSGPTGIAVDSSGDLFLADTGNNRVVEFSSTGAASVVSTGTITLGSPYSVAVYPSGQLVVSDKANGVVLINGSSSQVLSFGTAYTTTSAKGVTLDLNGNIFLSNTTGGQVLELNVNSPQSVAFPNTADGVVSAGITQPVSNEGNGSLILSGLAVSNNNFTIDSSSTCTSTATVAASASCNLVTKFTPQSVGPLTASVSLTDNQLSYTLNAAAPAGNGEAEFGTFGTSGTQALNLSGTATSMGAPQTITFPAPASPITYTTTPITLSATASSGLAVTFTVVSGPGTISGSTLSVTGVGTIVIAANQAGSINFSAAPQVTQSIVVNQAPQTITFTPTNPLLYTTTPVTLVATSSSGLPVSFLLGSGPATLSGSTLTLTGIGTVVISATQIGNANYAAATPVVANIVISPLGTVNTPQFAFAAGTYNASHLSPLTITDATLGATIYYTLDGSTPTTASTKYAFTSSSMPDGIVLSGTETVKAIAVLNGFATSAVAAGTYIIDTTTEGLTYSINPASLTLQPGGSGTIAISVTPQNGINATISFLCTGQPIGVTCNFNPSTIATGPTQAAVTTTLTVTAPTTTAAVQHNRTPWLPGTTLAAALCLFGWRRRRGVKLILMLALVSFGLSMASGCGGSTSGNQTSTVTVAISGDSVRVTPTFTLTVQ
jgi:Chitobiase/beta-hexosaminidase C-terminal domain/NHL repeat